MTPARWQHVKKVLESVLERPVAARDAFLNEACGGDSDLRSEVESLVRVHDADPGFIESPAVNEIGFGAARIPRSSVESMVGRDVGPYRVEKLIDAGGMGAVYEAIRADDAYRKKVAVKVIRADAFTSERHRFELHARFRAERQTLANLEHAHIARLLDGGTTADGMPYLVMEFIEGRPIDAYCDDHRLSIAQRLRLFRSVCAAVQYAHQKLVVHRDLKPGNILVDRNGSPRLLDFGIAKLLDPDSSALAGLVTDTSARPMTLAYASPEQIRGKPITTATDVYSLGVILYELVTGRRPYRMTDLGPHDLPRLICEEEPEKPSVAVTQSFRPHESSGRTAEEISRTRQERPSRLRRYLVGDLDTIILTALQKEPDRRYASVEQFAEDIRRHLEREPIVARKATAGYRLAKFVRRHRVGVAAACLVVLSLSGGLVGTTWMARKAENKRRAVEQLAGYWTKFYQPPGSEYHDLAPVDWSRRGKKKNVTLDSLVSASIISLPRIEEDPLTEADLRESMAKICSALRRFDDTLSLHQEVLAIRRRELSPDDPRTLEAVANVGFSLLMTGKWIEAKPCLEEAVDTGARVWGDSDLKTLTAMMNLGLVESKLGARDAAEKILRDALSAIHARLGEEHEIALRAANLLGKLLGEQKKLKEAESLLGRTVEISKQSKERGPNHPATLEACNNLAGVLYQQDRFEEAVAIFRDLFEGCQRVLGSGDEQSLLVGNNLARCLTRTNRLEEAETILEFVVSEADRKLPEGNFNAALFHGNYGECLASLGRCDEAKGHLDAAYRVIRKRMGPTHDATRKTVSRLADFHEKCGPAEKAREFREMLATWPEPGKKN